MAAVAVRTDGMPVRIIRAARDDRPADICFARGTFNSHPYVMGAMNVFLERLDSTEVVSMYDGLDERWNARAARFNPSEGRLQRAPFLLARPKRRAPYGRISAISDGDAADPAGHGGMSP